MFLQNLSQFFVETSVSEWFVVLKVLHVHASISIVERTKTVNCVVIIVSLHTLFLFAYHNTMSSRNSTTAQSIRINELHAMMISVLITCSWLSKRNENIVAHMMNTTAVTVKLQMNIFVIQVRQNVIQWNSSKIKTKKESSQISTEMSLIIL